MAETIRSTRDFLGDVRTELEKVTWPDWPQLKNSTGVIIAFVVFWVVKVVQRVPVKIVFDAVPKYCVLGPGMSVTPRVKVR